VNGKAVLAYHQNGSAEEVSGAQGFFALVNLEPQTAQQITKVHYDPDFCLFHKLIVLGITVPFTFHPIYLKKEEVFLCSF
jgi:hypothetical protein